ncbi:MAG: carbon-nitrogen hydrolase family protein [Hyphomicrobiaceae bacterium]
MSPASEADRCLAPRFRAGLVQMCTGRDVERNLATAGRLVREAAAQGAHYVQTPEVTTLMEMDRKRLFTAVAAEDGNPAITHFSGLARELGIWLHVGSMAVQVEPERLANRALLFRPDGGLAARYDKIHMFDVELPGGERYRESRNYRPGDEAVLVRLPWGNLGITICYDMRFPGLYRTLAHAGAEIIAVPSAFTVPTGIAHWHALLRARAIETQCFVLAAAQAGEHESGRKTYGHSIAISPWGEVIAEADHMAESVVLVDIDMARVIEARQRVPSLTHDRPFRVAPAAGVDPFPGTVGFG